MVEVWAADRADLFAEAARALFSTLTDLEAIEPKTPVPIRVGADSAEQLLVSWLTELLYLHETQQWLFSRFEVRWIQEDALEAEAWGERLDPSRHAIDREVKAVTYHRLGLVRQPGGFRTTIVFDL